MRKVIVEWINVIFWAGLIAIAFRSFLFEPFRIPSSSMVPNLLVGDYLFVNKFSYGYGRYAFPFGFPPFEGRFFDRPIERGEVVVFRIPDHDKDYIKRFIGMPGDRIQLKEGILYINGEACKREKIGEYLYHVENTGEIRRMDKFRETLPNGKSYEIIQEPDYQNPSNPYIKIANNTQEYVVPEGHYMGIGDNRDHSGDSRYLRDVRPSNIGYIPKQYVIGRASIKWFSLEDADIWQIWKWPSAIRFDRIMSPIR